MDDGLAHDDLREMLDAEIEESLFSYKRVSKEAFLPAWDKLFPNIRNQIAL